MRFKFKSVKNFKSQLKKPKSKSKPKIWIYADMEGINNITDWQEVNPAFIKYKKGAELMTEEVNSAIQGIRKCGCENIFINDLHWFYNNLIWGKISTKVLSCAGSNLNIKDFFSKNFDAVVIVGMHAKNETKNAILPHSWYLPSYIKSLSYNEKSIGEIKIIKLLADEKGVPVIFLSGDRAGCNEAIEICPNIVTAETKSINENGEIELLSRKKANRLVLEKAKEAIKKLQKNPDDFKTKARASKKPLCATFASKEIVDSVAHRCKVLGLDYKKKRDNSIQFNGDCFSQILKSFFSVLD